MNDEDLEVLITLDDPQYGPDEDTFHRLQPDTDRPGQPFRYGSIGSVSDGGEESYW